MDSRLRRSAASYVGSMKDRNLNKAYIRDSKNRVKSFVDFCEAKGVKCAPKITSEILRDYLKTMDGRKATSQKFIWAILHSFLVFAGSPMAARYKYRPDGRSRTVRWLTEDQQARLLSMNLKPRMRLMVVAGLYGGLRRGGVRQITREDAENALAIGVLTVVEKHSKERTIPVHPMLRNALEEMLRTTDIKTSGRLVPISDGHYTNEFRQLSNQMGFIIKAHDLRRTFALNLRKANVEMETVSLGLGHSRLETTQLYVRPMESKLKDAIEALPIPVQIQV